MDKLRLGGGGLHTLDIIIVPLASWREKMSDKPHLFKCARTSASKMRKLRE